MLTDTIYNRYNVNYLKSSYLTKIIKLTKINYYLTKI